MMPVDPRPSWKMRRRAVFGSLIFAGAIVTYITISGWDSGTAQTMAIGAFGLMGAIIAAYIGGAAYEDVRLHPQILQFQQQQDISNQTIDLNSDFEDNTQ